MHVIAFLNQKGGVGKTTLASQIVIRAAENFHKVCLIDLDTASSVSGAAIWFKNRKESELGDEPTLFSGVGDVAEAVDRAKRAGYEFVVLDGAPGAIGDTKAAIAGADVIVIPEKSSKDDITRTALIVRMCKDAGKGKVVVGVVNEVPTDKKSYIWKRAQEIKEGLAEFGLPVVVIHSRDQFVLSKDLGSGVHEMGGRATAAKNEIESLYQVIVAKLGFDGVEE